MRGAPWRTKIRVRTSGQGAGDHSTSRDVDPHQWRVDRGRREGRVERPDQNRGECCPEIDPREHRVVGERCGVMAGGLGLGHPELHAVEDAPAWPRESSAWTTPAPDVIRFSWAGRIGSGSPGCRSAAPARRGRQVTVCSPMCGWAHGHGPLRVTLIGPKRSRRHHAPTMRRPRWAGRGTPADLRPRRGGSRGWRGQSRPPLAHRPLAPPSVRDALEHEVVRGGVGAEHRRVGAQQLLGRSDRGRVGEGGGGRQTEHATRGGGRATLRADGPSGPARTRGPAPVSTICSVTEPEKCPHGREHRGVVRAQLVSGPVRPVRSPRPARRPRPRRWRRLPRPVGRMDEQRPHRGDARGVQRDQTVVRSFVVDRTVGTEGGAGPLGDQPWRRRRGRVEPVDVLEVALRDHDQDLAAVRLHRHQIGVRGVGGADGGRLHSPIWFPVLRL